MILFLSGLKLLNHDLNISLYDVWFGF